MCESHLPAIVVGQTAWALALNATGPGMWHGCELEICPLPCGRVAVLLRLFCLGVLSPDPGCRRSCSSLLPFVGRGLVRDRPLRFDMCPIYLPMHRRHLFGEGSGFVATEVIASVVAVGDYRRLHH